MINASIRSNKREQIDFGIPSEEIKKVYRQMLLVRRFEERSAEMYTMGKIGGFCHLYIGQEASGAGAITALRDDDYVITHYRDHGHAILKGVDPKRVMAELYGRQGGSVKGKGGSMHIIDVEKKFMGGWGIVGGQIPIANGMGYEIKYRKKNQVVLCIFGEGATNIGAFHEAMNLAVLWQLPVIFFCENNRYGMGTPIERASSLYNVFERASGYGMTMQAVDGMDFFTVREVVSQAAERARQFKPTLIESRTYRYRGHSMSDPAHYRTKEEVDEQKRHDPIVRVENYLLKHNLITTDELSILKEDIEREVQEAIDFAEQSPYPDISELTTDVYIE